MRISYELVDDGGPYGSRLEIAASPKKYTETRINLFSLSFDQNVVTLTCYIFLKSTARFRPSRRYVK